MNKKDLLKLMEQFDINYLESLLIKVFLRRNKISKIKNKLILNKINNIDEDDINRADAYLHKINGDLDLKNLERMFELFIEEKDRKLNGAFYTPISIVEYMVNKVINKESNICDCSCGSGAFLVKAAEKIKELTNKSIINIIEKNLYGVDISKRSIERTKLILSLLSLINNEDKEDINFNLVVGDSLRLDWKKQFPNIFKEDGWRNTFDSKSNLSGFDVIIGNPPYVRIQNLDDQTKKRIREKWSSAKKYNVDLYIPFIELSLDLINSDGKVCLITAKSYFDSQAGVFIRRLLRDNRYIEEILDFNFFQLFEDVITYTSIIILDKKPKDFLRYYKIQSKDELNKLDKLKFNSENYKDLPKDKIIINGYKHSMNIKKIINQQIKIGSKYPIKIGIATLRDKLYLIQKKNSHFVKEHNGKEYEIESDVIKKLLFANNIKSKNGKKVLCGWIIFPYEFKNGSYVILSEEKMKTKFPKCYKYFNSIKPELMKRDKGRERIKDYGTWYAYGRVQGYNAIGKKLICPNMMPKPRFETLKDDSLFIAGYGIVCNEDITWLKKIFDSNVFWYYVTMQGKKIRNQFYVIGKKLLGDFSIPEFNTKEKEFLIKETNQDKINEFLSKKYDLII